MKRACLLAILLVWSRLGSAQSTEELINDGKNTDNVTTQSMGYDRKSYSPLKQINRSNETREQVAVPVFDGWEREISRRRAIRPPRSGR